MMGFKNTKTIKKNILSINSENNLHFNKSKITQTNSIIYKININNKFSRLINNSINSSH